MAKRLATKKEEREALAEIRKIVESVGGENSYIGAAFTGAFEIAADNIDCDYMISVKERFEQDEEGLKNAITQINELERKVEHAEAEKGIAKQRIIELENDKRDLMDEIKTNGQAMELQEIRIGGLEREIIELKAKLYDMMTSADQ